MPVGPMSDRFHDVKWPRLSLGLAGIVTTVYVLQLALAPPSCWETRYPGFCAELVLLHETTWLGVVLMPFLHGSWTHLGGNLLMLSVFGGATERFFGSRPLVWLFVAGGYVSTELQLLAKLSAGQAPITVGISGAVLGLGAFVAVMFTPGIRDGGIDFSPPEDNVEEVLRWPLLAMGYFAMVYAVLTHLGVVPTDPRAATLSHLVGVAFGAGTGVYLRVVKPHLDGRSLFVGPFG